MISAEAKTKLEDRLGQVIQSSFFQTLLCGRTLVQHASRGPGSNLQHCKNDLVIFLGILAFIFNFCHFERDSMSP